LLVEKIGGPKRRNPISQLECGKQSKPSRQRHTKAIRKTMASLLYRAQPLHFLERMATMPDMDAMVCPVRDAACTAANAPTLADSFGLDERSAMPGSVAASGRAGDPSIVRDWHGGLNYLAKVLLARAWEPREKVVP